MPGKPRPASARPRVVEPRHEGGKAVAGVAKAARAADRKAVAKVLNAKLRKIEELRELKRQVKIDSVHKKSGFTRYTRRVHGSFGG